MAKKRVNYETGQKAPRKGKANSANLGFEEKLWQAAMTTSKHRSKCISR